MFGPRCFGCRALCWFLTCLMVVSPCGPLLAQREQVASPVLIADPADPPVDATLDLTYLLPDAVLVVSANPGRVLNSKIFSLFPIEVLQAAALQQTGLDPMEVEHVLFSMEPPFAGPPNYSLVTSHAASVVGKLHQQLLEHTQPGEHDGRPHFVSRHPLMPSIYQPDDRTIVATPEMTLKKFLGGNRVATENPLADRLIKAKGDDFYAALNLQPLRSLINGILMQQQVPPEMQPFLAAPDLISKVELRLNISQGGTSELVVEANNSADAQKLLGMLVQTFGRVQLEAAAEIAKLKADPDPVQRALGAYQERMIKHIESSFMPKREGATLVIFRHVANENGADAMTMTAVSGILVALLLPAVQAAREAARRATSTNNMKQLMLALFNHEDMHKSFPAYAIFDDEGKPLLSWRVRILPFLEQQQLYEQFRLDEPWDSEHNRALIEKMPAVFLDPSSRLTVEEGKTHYLGVKGEGYIFSGTNEGTRLRNVRDGTSNTIMLVQVSDERAAIWTKPEDWEPDPKNLLQGLANSLHPGIFLAALADGSVRNIANDVDEKTFKAMLTIDGGEVIPRD